MHVLHRMDHPMQFSIRAQMACLAILLTLWTGVAQGDTPAKKKLLLLGQAPDGHPPQTHEYIPGLQRLEKILQQVPELEVEFVRADEPWTDGPQLLQKADGAVLFLAEGGKWIQADPRRLDAFAALASARRRIVGLALGHWRQES